MINNEYIKKVVNSEILFQKDKKKIVFKTMK